MTLGAAAAWNRLDRIVGVYEANGGLAGELSYVVRTMLGGHHCSLCDITHSSIRRKREWDAFVRSLPVPFHAVHLNERDERVMAATRGRTPCAVGLLADGSDVLLLNAEELAACAGSVDHFADALRSAVLDLSDLPSADPRMRHGKCE